MCCSHPPLCLPSVSEKPHLHHANLPPLPFRHPPLLRRRQHGSYLGAASSSSPPLAQPSPTRPLWEGYNCCEWVAHLFPETGEGTPTATASTHLPHTSATSPPPYPHPVRVTTAPLLAFRSASLITALVSRLRRRQRALTGATRLQIPAPTFLMESASSGMFTFFPSFHPSGAPLTLQQG